MNTDQASLAERILLFLAQRPEHLERFLAVTGLAPTDLRRLMTSTDFQAGLLDFLLSDEPLLLAYCEESGDDPVAIARSAAPFQQAWE